MLLADLQNPDNLESLPIVDGIDPSITNEQSGYLQVGEWLALPVSQVTCRIDGRTDPEILDETGGSLGTLCLTDKLEGLDLQALTKWQYVAYLADVEAVGAGRPHTFQRNYVVLNERYLNNYLEKYYHSAPIWGGFSHLPPAVAVKREYETLTAREGIVFPTRFHEMAFSRYISANNAFERFLRLYHSLELIFDFIIFKSIQKLGNDMVGFGAISRAHGKSELDRLKYILAMCCEDWEGIADKFRPITKFQSKAVSIFQDHTKDGNPLGESGRWLKVCENCLAGQTTEVDFKNARIIDNKDGSYSTIVINISAYWIYRVRSSIAHSRVSEFIFEDSDEEFIVHFVEGILEEVVRQVFSSSKLKSLMET